ncbi:hypothetical protein POM88_024618 [Heracleum sosnowskyi]|uniref:Uncharacterized protein n=1 Tax=Heracleum sosnowskyi TaxID=360622 RepID=A0AAD8I2D5_9APIA|nr:hypothetical protein POM88_024618 [Heracleum sosnowskyi]
MPSDYRAVDCDGSPSGNATPGSSIQRGNKDVIDKSDNSTQNPIDVEVYESLIEDEADIRENENVNENTKPSTEGSVQAKKGKEKEKGVKRKWKYVEASKNMYKDFRHRQMILSSSHGSMSMHSGAFDPKIFRDMITDAVVRHNLPLSFVEYEGIREAFKYANSKAILSADPIMFTEECELTDPMKIHSNSQLTTSDLLSSSVIYS